MSKRMDNLEQLEHEAIYIIRETFAQFKKPAIMFSGGKDSICLVHLAKKAFAPVHSPFPLVHIDTGHNFKETIEFRDQLVKSINANLIVGSVQDAIDAGKVNEEAGPYATRNYLQSVTLLDTIQENGFDAMIGGARRDEEKARAKERVFSVRNAFGQWEPRSQRPEIWSILNGKINDGEHIRVFPLSNWTELDVWNYIKRERIELPSLYFAHQREVVEKPDGTLLATSDIMKTDPKDPIDIRTVRFRTIGDMTCTGAVLSQASNIDQVIEEIKTAKTTERGTRADDKKSESAMEDRKKEGYF